MKSIYVTLVALGLVAAGCGSSDGPQTPGDTTSVPTTLATDGKDGHRRNDSRMNVVQVVDRSDIVSNLPGAEVQDQNLQNAWGIAFNPGGAAWVSANGTGLSFIVNEEGQQLIPAVTIPPPQGGTPPSTPTGQVFNSNANAFNGDKFIFATEDGTISGWQGGASALLRVDRSTASAVFKGLTLALNSSGQLRLYAANFNAGTIDVWDDGYHPVQGDQNSFRDRRLPDGFAPFNVQEINGLLYVTYALQDQDKKDDVKGVGNGFVNVFDPDGNLVSRLIRRGSLNSPWGLALAPDSFGALGNRLLVGNFGDGFINVYSLDFSNNGLDASHDGVLGSDRNTPIAIDGLWALRFGVDAGGFSSADLYFTAGPNDEADGIFGELDAREKKVHRHHHRHHRDRDSRDDGKHMRD